MPKLNISTGRFWPTFIFMLVEITNAKVMTKYIKSKAHSRHSKSMCLVRDSLASSRADSAQWNNSGPIKADHK
jgi:hypothetical protein